MRPPAWFLAAALAVLSMHPSASAAEPIDLNSASVEQLQTLPGIGLRKAEAIVSLRQKRPFSRVTQLLEVRGIGKKTLARLKPLVGVDLGKEDRASSASPSAARQVGKSIKQGPALLLPKEPGPGSQPAPCLESCPP